MMKREFLVTDMNKFIEVSKPTSEVSVETLRKQVPNSDETPQVQYFSSDVAIKDTSDGPKVSFHCYGNNDEDTMKRAVIGYLETIKILEQAKKEGRKIGMDKHDV